MSLFKGSHLLVGQNEKNPLRNENSWRINCKLHKKIDKKKKKKRFEFEV